MLIRSRVGVFALTWVVAGCGDDRAGPGERAAAVVQPRDAGAPGPVRVIARRPSQIFGDGFAAGDCDDALAGTLPQAPLRRLSRDEYRNTVRDLFGLDEHRIVVSLPDDAWHGVVVGGSLLPPGASEVAQYREAARQIAGMVMESDRIARLLPCDPQRGSEPCAEQFIRGLGRRAFRRLLDHDQVDGLLEVYRTAGGDFLDGIRLVLRAMLESPYFLYQVEHEPAATNPTALHSNELAARLSYYLWDSMPDAELFRAAETGELATSAGLRAQAQRMLDDAKAGAGLASFTGHWLTITGVETSGPGSAPVLGWNEQIAAAAELETVRFVDHALRGDGERSFSSLLTAQSSFPGQLLWDVYGVMPDASYDGSTALELPAGQRAGVLTQASVLALHSGENVSAVRRGKFVLDSLLCAGIGLPSTGLPSPPPRPAGGVSVREALEASHRQSVACAPCHDKIDPFGFALDAYDRRGALRDSDENGEPIDTRAQLAIGDPTLDGPVDGALDLAHKLAASDTAKACMVRQLYRFALQRDEVNEDTCSLVSLARAFEDSAFDVRALMIAIVTADSFRFRPGVSP